MVLMVATQKVRHGKWEELKELLPRWAAVEERLGNPVGKTYQCGIGGHEFGTRLILREFESLAAIEPAFARFFADPEGQELQAQVVDLLESTQYELYMPEEW